MPLGSSVLVLLIKWQDAANVIEIINAVSWWSILWTVAQESELTGSLAHLPRFGRSVRLSLMALAPGQLPLTICGSDDTASLPTR